jgi:hypothetical protein
MPGFEDPFDSCVISLCADAGSPFKELHLLLSEWSAPFWDLLAPLQQDIGQRGVAQVCTCIRGLDVKI